VRVDKRRERHVMKWLEETLVEAHLSQSLTCEAIMSAFVKVLEASWVKRSWECKNELKQEQQVIL